MNVRINSILLLAIITISCSSNTVEQEVKLEAEVIQTIRELSEDNILICVHRATNKDHPENSLSAINASIFLGVDIIELDVRTTKDDSLVIMHDHDIDRTTNGSGYVSTMTYQELLEYNLLHSDTLTNEKIPTLRQVLKITYDKKVILNLDLKDINVEDYYALLREFKMEHKVMSYIWDPELMTDILDLDSLYAVLPLANNIREVRYYNEYVLSKLIHFTDESYKDEIIQEAKNNEQLIFINSLWETDEFFLEGNTAKMDSLIIKNPAIIQTDYPEELLKYLKQEVYRN
ncbi:MAG: hypothetical protein BalsKO_06840 [Balneolaceae bacterium]